MDRDGKYTLRACNIRLEASKAQGLVEFYGNKLMLSKCVLDNKIMKIVESKMRLDKKEKNIKSLQDAYKKTSTDYLNLIKDNSIKYTELILSVTRPPSDPSEGTSGGSAEEQV
jgi:hypothetical protein